MNDLEPLWSLYLPGYILTLIAPIKRSPEQTCAMGEQFNNFLPTRQVQMMYTILNEEKTRLHAIIRATLV